MNIGKSVKEVRKALGVTQNELAEKSGLTQGAISQIENSQTHPNKETLGKIAEALGVIEEVLVYKALTIDDIGDNKKEIFQALNPAINMLVDNIIESVKNEKK